MATTNSRSSPGVHPGNKVHWQQGPSEGWRILKNFGRNQICQTGWKGRRWTSCFDLVIHCTSISAPLTQITHMSLSTHNAKLKYNHRTPIRLMYHKEKYIYSGPGKEFKTITHTHTHMHTHTHTHTCTHTHTYTHTHTAYTLHTHKCNIHSHKTHIWRYTPLILSR